jgi:hypothetical protein
MTDICRRSSHNYPSGGLCKIEATTSTTNVRSNARYRQMGAPSEASNTSKQSKHHPFPLTLPHLPQDAPRRPPATASKVKHSPPTWQTHFVATRVWQAPCCTDRFHGVCGLGPQGGAKNNCGHELRNHTIYSRACLRPRWARNAQGGTYGWSHARTRIENHTFYTRVWCLGRLSGAAVGAKCKAARLAEDARGHELNNHTFYTRVWCLGPWCARNAQGRASGGSCARTRVEQPYILHSRLVS